MKCEIERPKVPCGKTMGHGYGCTETMLCERCEYILQLEAENAELAAHQCHDGYAGEGGNHRCKYQDRIEELTHNKP